MKMKKLIIFAVLVSMLAIAFIIPSVAVLPSYPDSSINAYITTYLSEVDVTLLFEGIQAQCQLGYPLYKNIDLLFVTLVRYSDSIFYYRGYYEYPGRDCTQTLGYASSTGVSGVCDEGGYITASGAVYSRFGSIDLTASGGVMSAEGDGYIGYKSALSMFGYKLDDNEILVAYLDSSGDIVLPAPSEYYTQSQSDPDGSILYVLTQMRSMANTWIAARDAKAGKTTSSGGTYSEGYEAGYDVGYNDGFDVGKSYGLDEGSEIGYQDGYAAGNASGYDRGYAAGDASGYDRGYDDGVEDGNTSGYQNGYAAGTSDGYDRGYSEGVLKADQGAQIDISAVVTAVPAGVKSLITNAFGFEIFGINVAGLLFTLIAVTLTFFVVKRFKG